MTVQITSPNFKGNTGAALKDAQLQRALGKVEAGFISRRTQVANRLPEFEALRDAARDIKDHTLAHLDLYLEAYERRVIEAGGKVHWAATAEDARNIVLEICKRRSAKIVTKGKSMIGEEIGINDHLEANGMTPVETDLGEYIVQIRHEVPSHIIAPAIHLNKDQIEADFRRVHTGLPPERNLEEPVSLMAEARQILRDKFLRADVGITGANFLIAETGTSVIVTNEGNGDLTQTLPKAHIVLASIEKVVPTLEDVSTMLRVLARSATGQEMSVYTTFSTGPRRPEDVDGPEEYHVVILDNGRSSMLAGQFREMLRCIRCGACMNHCPVYLSVGGHAYGWVYPGPMGSVLTPALIGIEKAAHLPNASTFCGRCEEVCPGAYSAAKNDASLARTGVRKAPFAGDVASGPRFLGGVRAQALAVPACDAACDEDAVAARRQTGPLQVVAARPRLDQAPRFSGSRARHVPGAMETASAR